MHVPDVPVVLELTHFAQQLPKFCLLALSIFINHGSQSKIFFADRPSFALVRPHSTWSLRYQITLSKQNRILFTCFCSRTANLSLRATAISRALSYNSRVHLIMTQVGQMLLLPGS